MKIIEHKGLNLKVSIKEPTQGEFEIYSAKMKEEKNLVPDPSRAQLDGAIVRSAIAAGWVVEPVLKPEDVANLTRAQVRWLSDQISQVYVECSVIPPE